ncbi:glycosyltransferase [Sporosarcina thermotolerans]|uniref:Glycosyltransferase n=1 Tax=Sporosarcina thermotolerans TaxID=633404 RepID=A0AAW9A5T7_9BACL|nr:glycosyltransferase [Sporosarcina thermotolerans]MDW0116304.1 glycosyltransferase [Sporosarcina thermotolerans]WHT48272.1 glycosyltransferase [Sporosarcina thermotolerans]
MNGERVNRNLKCLLLVPRMGGGGAERVLATLANELSQRGYDIVILTLTSNESFYQLDPKVKIIGAGYKINRSNKLYAFLNIAGYGVKSLFFVKNYIKEWKPDIILSFLTHTNIIALMAHLFNPRIPLIISERTEPKVRKLPLRMVTKYLYPTANCIVCQSKKVTEFFPKYANKKMRVIPNPINLGCIVRDDPIVRRKAIIGVGRLFPEKNFSLLIESFNDLKDEFPEHVLEIYGDGYLRNELQEKINLLGLRNRAFLMGLKKDVMKYVYDAELFVMPSNYEGFPNALVEAMSSGVPVISTDFSTGIARELIKEENGILVPVDDKEHMRNAIRRILSDNNLRNSMSRKNREILDVLSADKIVDMWIHIFDELLMENKV